MNFNADYFELFALPQCFLIDQSTLEQRYRELQTKIHPDRFVNASEQDKRFSLQWATRINEAFQTLKKPLSRAQYLLELHGYAASASNPTLSEAFLVDQIIWRERIQDALEAADIDELERLYAQIVDQIKVQYAQLAIQFDDRSQYNQALERVRQLMFLEKLKQDADEAIVKLEK